MATGTATQQHGELLRRSLLFAGLDRVTLARLAARFQVVCLDDGEAVMRQGEVGDAMYVISRGHFGVEGRLFSHRQVRSVTLMYGVMTLLALCLSVPLWHVMGLF